MIDRIKKEFIKFINDNKLINVGDGIVVGLSGGPDSVCLLNLLVSIKEEFNLKLAAVHINHMLRGDAANEDEEFCLKLCKELDVDFFSERIDVNKYSKENNLSSETAGREVRYNTFNKIMYQKGFNKIATAHNANDQAETIIMRMMRGTGLEGLCGIPVIRENRYIRPILFMERKDIEAYCEEIEIEARIDKSNLERIYSRNKVRLDIIPYMKDNFNIDVISAINRMSILLQEDNEYILSEVETIYKENVQKDERSSLIKNDIFKLNNSIKKRIIRRVIKDICGNKYDIEMKHIEDIIQLSKNKTGKQIDLPNNVVAINEYGDIRVKLRDVNELIEEKQHVLSKEKILHNKIQFNSYIVEFNVTESDNKWKYSNNSLIKHFDFDKINGNIIIRYRKNGDKIIPLGLNGSKKVKDVFIDMKIPKEKRDFIPIVEFGGDIAWIVGVKLSDKYKVDVNTKNILKIQFKLI